MTISAMFVAWSAVRSRSVTIFSVVVMNRRSIAVGWWSASSSPHFSSISTSQAFTCRSRSMTSCACGPSRSMSARMTRRIWSSTSPPIASRVCLSASSSSWKCRDMAPPILDFARLGRRGPSPRDVVRLALLPEPAGDVVLGPLVARVREERARHTELDQLAQEHEARGVGHAGRLLHVVGHDDDRVAVLQLEHQLLDLRRGDGIEGRARLVHQEHVRLDRDRARDAEPLLLPAREPEGALAEAVLDLVPERGGPEAALDGPLEIGAARHP